MKEKSTQMDIVSLFIGNQVEQQRKDAGLSQSELGVKVGLTRASIANIESGRQRCTFYMIYKICDALNIVVSCLMPTQEWFDKNKNRKVQRVVRIEIIEEDEIPTHYGMGEIDIKPLKP